MDSSAPPSNPFGASNVDNSNSNNGDGAVSFDAFSLSSSDGNPSAMPSLQSLQNHQQQLERQQQQYLQHQPRQQHAQQPATQNETQWENSLPSPQELQGRMTSQDSTWPPPPPPSNFTSSDSFGSNNANGNNANSNNGNSFFNRFLSCVTVDSLRPYFDVDTADVLVRIRGSVKYCLVNDGFRNEVLYSDNALRLSVANGGTSSSSGAGGVAGEGANESGEVSNGGQIEREQQGQAQSATGNNANTANLSSGGKGPDLYGPIWITMTLVFFVAVTSNISIYVHHNTSSAASSSSSSLSDVISETPIQAEQEWDYDINRLLRATSILYSFSILLPFLLFFVFRIVGVISISMVEMICLYGYSLVPYLPATWICIAPYDWARWLSLGMATVVSGMLVLRNLMGGILTASGGSAGGGMGGKGGGLIMALMGCHFVFLLVMKLAFYHHR